MLGSWAGTERHDWKKKRQNSDSISHFLEKVMGSHNGRGTTKGPTRPKRKPFRLEEVFKPDELEFIGTWRDQPVDWLRVELERRFDKAYDPGDIRRAIEALQLVGA